MTLMCDDTMGKDTRELLVPPQTQSTRAVKARLSPLQCQWVRPVSGAKGAQGHLDGPGGQSTEPVRIIYS